MRRLEKLVCAELERQLASNNAVPRLPAGSELLWRWFADLNRGRTFGLAGPDPLQYTQIEAYARLTRWPLEQRHISVLMQMDATYLRFHASRRANTEGVKALPPISQVPLSAGLLDAMFG
ncbi:hypothetical protein QE369_001203 [Agrobacterium larrymoorei]|uniref:Uncharacterized protein n=1 Tax=Agrobacterium larrymoorei TaxID=160699 RepID=A0AAJ2B7V4_9HYPH|nr:hypothetical protein [Agrobacterium larrymoorei]MDR6101025.1 hypothetical protein [Agrobacterium larrymoorei]